MYHRSPKAEWLLISDPSVYIHSSDCNLGLHECGVGSVNVVDGSVVVHPSGRKGISNMPGRAWEDVYPPDRCVGEVAHGGSCSTREMCNRIVDIFHARVLLSVPWPRSWTLCRAESPGAAVSPIRIPMRASLTSADGLEEVSETYNIPLPRIPLRTRKGAVSGWVPMYGSGSRKVVCFPWCGPLGSSEGCVLHMKSLAVSGMVSTGRVGATCGRVPPPGRHGA